MRINEIVLRKRGVTAETVLRLARYTEPMRGLIFKCAIEGLVQMSSGGSPTSEEQRP